MGYILRKCEVCNKEYLADERNIKRGWGLCCSKSCAAIKRERNKVKVNNKTKNNDDDTLEKYLEYKDIMKNEYENKKNYIFTMVTSSDELDKIVDILRKKKYYYYPTKFIEMKNNLSKGLNVYVGVFSNYAEFSLHKKYFSSGKRCKCKYYRKERVFLNVVSIAYQYYKYLWWHNFHSKFNENKY